jgi:cell pole-organizing protein PopZ
LSRSMNRRRFVRLLAAGAAAAAAAPLGATAAKARQAAIPGQSRPKPRAVTSAMRKEIEVQKKSIADMLAVIRAYELPAGSPPAPIFHAIRAARRER